MKRIALILVTALNLFFAGRAQRVAPPRPRVTGNSLFFNGWVKATVVSRNSFFQTDSMYLFDFDKASQNLLATRDKETVYKFNKREFESVTFYSDAYPITFAHVPAINDKDVFQEIVKNEEKYSLYMLIHNGVRGNSFVDWFSYYIVFPFPNTRAARLKVMDQKVLDHLFDLSGDRKKVDAYYALHNQETHNEYFLKKLIEYLNQ